MLKTTYSRQKSYADNRRRDLQFEIGDHVYLKISPMKGVMRFVKKVKLSPRYVGPYEVLQRVGKVSYELQLPNELASVNPVFYVSMLKKCIAIRYLFCLLKVKGWMKTSLMKRFLLISEIAKSRS